MHISEFIFLKTKPYGIGSPTSHQEKIFLRKKYSISVQFDANETCDTEMEHAKRLCVSFGFTILRKT